MVAALGKGMANSQRAVGDVEQMVRMASDGAPDGMDVELALRSGARDPV